MDISVIIVNYNVRYFLEQALRSVRRASDGLETEVIVVDNASSDGSVDMVRRRFPEIDLIVNEDNVGFSRANNQGIERTTGRYVLLLNPDTILQEDSLHILVDYMDAHPEMGAAGVRMIDGKGRYLPESKRGFPSPFVAFCKAFGLSALFPKSALLNRYYLGHLDPGQNQEVDVLCGAFMFIRKEVLDEVGGLDERFFMYGEDIDLSYRIQKAGFKNAYIADTSIIHFKGESTKKSSTAYIRRFYRAMQLFARKHFSNSGAALLGYMFTLAIWFRAAITLIRTVLHRIKWAVLDIGLMAWVVWGTKELWARVYHGNPDYYPEEFIFTNLPLYVMIWFCAHYLSGAYDKTFQMGRLLRGHLIGTLFLLALYGLLPDYWRTSRVIILISAILSWGVLWGTKRLKKSAGRKEKGADVVKKIALVATLKGSKRIVRLLDRANVNYRIAGMLAPGQDAMGEGYVTDVGNLSDYVRAEQIDEVIFNADELSMQDIMDWMGRIDPGVDIKIVSSEGEGIIGSSSIHTSGELYAVQLQYRLNHPVYRRYKRIVDLLICLFVLICLPLWPWLDREVIRGLIPVIKGDKTWVGYFSPDEKMGDLPSIRKSVFPFEKEEPEDGKTLHRLNTLYARDYHVGWDINRMIEAAFQFK